MWSPNDMLIVELERGGGGTGENTRRTEEKFASLARKMDFYLTTSESTFPCFQIT